MGQRYVAFLDVLGFKGQVGRKTQDEAEIMIEGFADTARTLWESEGFERQDGLVKAMTASDSVIVYTENDTTEALQLLMHYAIRFCRVMFEKNRLLIRGAVAKGEFVELDNPGLAHFREHLMVGQAFVNAYTLEGQYKSSTILLYQNVREDIAEKLGNSKYPTLLLDADRNIYWLPWADYEYIMDTSHMSRFAHMASESGWRSHYYNTLYSFLCSEPNETKRSEALLQIMQLVGQGNPERHQREVDAFITNAFEPTVGANARRMFVTFLRKAASTGKIR